MRWSLQRTPHGTHRTLHDALPVGPFTGTMAGGGAVPIGVRGLELRSSCSPGVPNSTTCVLGKPFWMSAFPRKLTWSGRNVVKGGSNGVLNLPSPTPPSSTSVTGISVSFSDCLNRSRLMLRPTVDVCRTISSYEGPAIRSPGAARFPCVKLWLEDEEYDGWWKRCDRAGPKCWCDFEWSKSEL